VVGLDRQDAGRRRQDRLAVEQRGGALVGGHADVLEHEGAEQERVLVRERVEGAQARQLAERPERGREVDRRAGHPGGAERAAEELDVVLLVARDLLGVLPDLRVGEVHLRPPTTAPRVPLPVVSASASLRPTARR
jgi:hypothetical protein